MKVFLTTRITKEISRLEKQKASLHVKKDICAFFDTVKSIEELICVPKELLPRSVDVSRKKSRIINSVNREKRGGFRLYYIVHHSKSAVILASIYSKKKINNYSVTEIKEVFSELNEDLKHKRLVEVDAETLSPVN